VFLAYWN